MSPWWGQMGAMAPPVGIIVIIIIIILETTWPVLIWTPQFYVKILLGVTEIMKVTPPSNSVPVVPCKFLQFI